MAVNSLGFLFASHIPDWVLKKLATQKQQMDKRKNKMPTKKNKQKSTHKKKPNQPNKTDFSSQRPKEGAAWQEKNTFIE